MPYAINGNVKTHYETRGDGPPLLMLMGWQGNRTWWPESLLSGLETHYRLILIDHRGTGLSSDTPGLYALVDLARDAVGVLDTLGIDKADILGVSMGGMVAQELSLHFPDRARKLVLISTSAKPRSLEGMTEKQKQAWIGYLKKRDRKPREFLLDLLFSRDCKNDPPPNIKNFISRVSTQRAPQKTIFKQYIAIQRFNSRKRLKRLGQPTLVITGTDDLIVPSRHSHDLHVRLPNARLHEIVGGSHALLDASAVELTHEIQQFLQKESNIPA